MIIKFQPIAIKKIWGGNKLSKIYGISSSKIGEIWGISTYKSNSTKIVNTSYKNITLRELYESHKELFGYYSKEEFPILMKVIDAVKDLSVQVHPDDEYANKEESSYGKDECWYILDVYSKDNNIIIGHNAKNKSELSNLIKNESYDRLLKRITINIGDYFYISAGKIHAICKYTTVLEISQSSNITYRLYDYNRLDNGVLRDLHIKKAYGVISTPDYLTLQKNPGKYFTDSLKENLVDSNHKAHKYGDYIYIKEGFGQFDNTQVKAGDFIMATSLSEYIIIGEIKYIIVNLVDF